VVIDEPAVLQETGVAETFFEQPSPHVGDDVIEVFAAR
jgi:hypothetical protein